MTFTQNRATKQWVPNSVSDHALIATDQEGTEAPAAELLTGDDFASLAKNYDLRLAQHGLNCQTGWETTSRHICQQMIDCWRICNVTWHQMAVTVKPAVSEKRHQRTKKRRETLQMFYNRVLERLIEHSRSLPPNLILHEFAINAVHITEQVCPLKQFHSFVGLIFCIGRFLLGRQIIDPLSGEGRI